MINLHISKLFRLFHFLFPLDFGSEESFVFDFDETSGFDLGGSSFDIFGVSDFDLVDAFCFDFVLASDVFFSAVASVFDFEVPVGFSPVVFASFPSFAAFAAVFLYVDHFLIFAWVAALYLSQIGTVLIFLTSSSVFSRSN